MRRLYEDISGPEEKPVRKRWELSEKTKDRMAGCVATLIIMFFIGFFMFFEMLPGLPGLVNDIGYLIEDIQRYFGW